MTKTKIETHKMSRSFCTANKPFSNSQVKLELLKLINTLIIL